MNSPLEILNARATEVRIIDLETASEFLEENHSQETARGEGRIFSLGLFHKDNLVSVIQFCSPRTTRMKKKYSLELLRLATKKNVRIRGGASKLIKYFINSQQPADFFTYQDMAGEATDVYKHAGLTLVSQGKKKQYLVAPEKTRSTANRKEILGIPYATRFGPDRILKTSLGEVYRSDGTRKTNPELFIEELGWHIEETPGDRIWEWFNPNLTFYTYKITATDSDKYYYGVSHVKKANASIEDCLNDGYFGTGGGKSSLNNKFVNWKTKHGETVKKEILEQFSRKMEAYNHEKILIGKAWANDPLCLNSVSGGLEGGLNYINSRASIKEKKCNVHGISLHAGDTCLKCSAKKRFTIQECKIHGKTKFAGKSCIKCYFIASLEEEECSLHGLSLHRKGLCIKCANGSRVSLKSCPIHGETNFIGAQCYYCIDNNIVLKACAKGIHGRTLHRGTHCIKCTSEELHQEKFCEKCQKKTTHKGDSCVSCYIQKQITIDLCTKGHGKTKFQAGKCGKCNSAKLYSLKECQTSEGDHGLTKHRKDDCIRCINLKSMTMEECTTGHHGFSKHQKGRCCLCVGEKTRHTIWHIRKNKIDETCIYCIK
jgi:hypothetical protein